MAFENDGLEIYSNKAEDEMEFLDENEIVIDNGSDRVKVNLNKIRHDIEHLMREENVSKIINRIRDFADKVKTDKEKGVHTGSSELAKAVSSEIFLMKSQDLGFDPEKEKQLVQHISNIIEECCDEDDILEFN